MIERRMPLAGGNIRTGECPFHADVQRDLRVYVEARRFECAGCGASGGVVEFVARFDRLSYTVALRSVAAQAGFELPEPLADWKAPNPAPRLEPPMPVLRITRAGELFDVVVCPWSAIKIGRLRSSHLVFDDPQVSRMHAVLEVLEHAVRLIDLGSAEGSLRNGVRVVRNDAIAVGDKLQFGGNVVEVLDLVRPSTPFRAREAAQRSVRIGLERVEQAFAEDRLVEALTLLGRVMAHVCDPAIERVAARLHRHLGEPPTPWLEASAPAQRWLDADNRASLDAIERAVVRLAGDEGEALELAVLHNPSADAPRMVLADWLQQRGDPRGELIALQLAGARAELDDDGRTRVAELLAEHGERWSAELAGEGAEVEFRRGFPALVRYPGPWSLALIDAVRRWRTIERCEGPSVPDVLRSRHG